MASRVFLRIASTGRPLLRSARPSPHWRCLSVVPVSRSGAPSTSSYVIRRFLSPACWQPARSLASATVTVEDLESRVMGVLQLFDKVDPSKVSVESHFIDDLGLDSLDVVEIIMAFEDEFGIEIDDDTADKILTVKDAVEVLKKSLDIEG